MLENDFLPAVMVDQTEIIFDEVRFMESFCKSLAIANTGQVLVLSFLFHSVIFLFLRFQFSLSL